MPAERNRATIKIERALWDKVNSLIRAHPEWGVLSVPEFVRRAIDSEIRSRGKDKEVL